MNSKAKPGAGLDRAGHTAGAVLALGFRPFYLLAGGYAAVSMLVWSLQFSGWLPGRVPVHGAWWHAHEMLFGYTFAVIAGFLLTAVRNWTQQPTPSGLPLAALAALWLAGRVLSFTTWREWSAITDTLFALGLAAGIGLPLARSGNRRNYFFVLLVLAIGAANLAFHAAAAGAGGYSPARALWLAADVVLLIMAVVAGRVIPLFTNNAVAGAGARRLPAIEYAALASLVALALADLGALHPWTGVVAGAAALVHAVRLALWAPLATRRVPLLWILHLSYAWVVVHLVLRAAADFGLVTPSVAMHALAVGGIGGLTLGMMTRSALGHTGRPLVAGRPEILAYVLVQLSAVTRVLVPLAAPGVYLQSVGASGLLWSLAFVVFTLAYAPMLTRPRIDGRPG